MLFLILHPACFSFLFHFPLSLLQLFFILLSLSFSLSLSLFSLFVSLLSLSLSSLVYAYLLFLHFDFPCLLLSFFIFCILHLYSFSPSLSVLSLCASLLVFFFGLSYLQCVQVYQKNQGIESTHLENLCVVLFFHWPLFMSVIPGVGLAIQGVKHGVQFSLPFFFLTEHLIRICKISD